jgi:hypothetical protein
MGKAGMTLSTFDSSDTPVGHKFNLQGINRTYVGVYCIHKVGHVFQRAEAVLEITFPLPKL